jgi:putative DNA primase/helicase
MNDRLTASAEILDALRARPPERAVPPLDHAFDTDESIELIEPDGVILTSGADLKPEPVRWLWNGWLALGKLHVLAGAPGQGKTTIAIAMAATVTVGGRWPDGSRCEAGNVLIWSGEDDPADTLLPRLLAAGGNEARIFFVTGTRFNGEVQSFDPARDIAGLERAADIIGGVKLLIVDPVVSAVAGDSHKNTEVRRALQPLVDLASRLDASALGISHFSKGGAGADPASRVVGSIAFTAVARVVLVAAKVRGEDGEDRRILARGKSNIGPDDGGFEYHIEQSEPLPGIQASYIAWGQVVAGTARELLQEPDELNSDGKSAVDAASDFLRQVLAKGITPTKTVEIEAKNAGVSWASVKRAADKLGVLKKKGSDAWYWKLPNLLNQGVQDVQRQEVEQVEPLEQVDGFDQASASRHDDQGAQGAQEVDAEQDEQEVEHLDPSCGADPHSGAEDAEVF